MNEVIKYLEKRNTELQRMLIECRRACDSVDTENERLLDMIFVLQSKVVELRGY